MWSIRGTLATLALAAGLTPAAALSQSGDPAAGRMLEALRTLLPADAQVTAGGLEGDPFAGEGVIRDLQITFSKPYRAGGASADQAAGGVQEVRAAKLVGSGLVEGADAGAMRAAKLELQDYTARIVPGVVVRAGDVIYENAALADVANLVLLVPPHGDQRASGTTEVRDFAVEDAGSGTHLAMARAATAATEQGVARDNVIEGINLLTPEVEMHVARVSLPTIDLATSLALAERTRAAAPAPPTPGEAFALFQSLLSGLPELTIDDMQIRLLEPGGSALTIGHFVYRFGSGQDGATRLAVEVRPVSLDRRDLPPQIAGEAALLGSGPIQLGFSLEGSWDEPTRRLTVSPLRLDLEGAGSVEVTAEFGSLPPAEVLTSMSQEDLGQTLALTPLRHAVIAITDAGFVGRWLAAVAQQQGVTREVLTTSIVESLNNILSGRGAAAGRRNVAVLEAVRSFLLKPGRLSLTYAPPDPRPLILLGETATQRPAALLLDSRVDYTPPGG